MFDEKKVINDIFKDKKSPKKPKLKILLGIAGSGKGTIAKKYKLDNIYTISVNYDELIMKNPNYQKEIKLAKTKKESQDIYWNYRKALSSIDNKANDIALKKRYSILWETTGSNIGWIYQYLSKFYKAGYFIEIHYPVVNFQDLEKRIKLREKQTGQEGAPIEQLRKDKAMIEENIIRLIPYVNHVYFYDNTGKTLKRSMDIKDIYDAKCYKDFTKKFGKFVGETFGEQIKIVMLNKSCKR